MRKGYQSILEMNTTANSAKERTSMPKEKKPYFDGEKSNSYAQTMSTLYGRTFNQSQDSIEKDYPFKVSNSKIATQKDEKSLSNSKSKLEKDVDEVPYKNKVEFFQTKITKQSNLRPSSNSPATVSHFPRKKTAERKTIIIERDESSESDASFQQKVARSQEKANNASHASNYQQKPSAKEKMRHEMGDSHSKNSKGGPSKREFHFKYKDSGVKNEDKSKSLNSYVNSANSYSNTNILKVDNEKKNSASKIMVNESHNKNLSQQGSENYKYNIMQNKEESYPSVKNKSYTEKYNWYGSAGNEKTMQDDNKSKITYFESKTEKPRKNSEKSVRNQTGFETKIKNSSSNEVKDSPHLYQEKEPDLKKNTKHFVYRENKNNPQKANSANPSRASNETSVRHKYKDSHNDYVKDPSKEPTNKSSAGKKYKEISSLSTRSKNESSEKVSMENKLHDDSPKIKLKQREPHPRPVKAPQKPDSVSYDGETLGTNNYTRNNPLDGVPTSSSELDSFKKRLEKTLLGKANPKKKSPAPYIDDHGSKDKKTSLTPSTPSVDYDMQSKVSSPKDRPEINPRRGSALPGNLLQDIKSSSILKSVGPRKEHEIDGTGGPKNNSGVHIPPPDY